MSAYMSGGQEAAACKKTLMIQMIAKRRTFLWPSKEGSPMRARRASSLRALGFVCLYTWGFGSVVASAHQSPAACTGNSLVVNLSRSRSAVLNGDAVTYYVSFSNID